MASVTLHFHGTLNDFLRPTQRHRDLTIPLLERTAVKHPIESLGVPHPEVEAILVNHTPVEFGYWLADADSVHVYPVDTPPPTDQRILLRPSLEPPIRFLLDTHLGVLASYLRLLGFDTLYRNDFDDPELAVLATREQRVLLTRDRGLLKRKAVVFGYCVRESDPRHQLNSVIQRYQLSAQIDPWQRCLRCNGRLVPVAKADILDRLQPKTRLYYDDFQRCTACGHIYWRGSHCARLEELVQTVTQYAAGDDDGTDATISTSRPQTGG